MTGDPGDVFGSEAERRLAEAEQSSMEQITSNDTKRSQTDSETAHHQLEQLKLDGLRKTFVFRLVVSLVIALTSLSTLFVVLVAFDVMSIDRYVLIAFLGGSVAQSYLLMRAIAQSFYPQYKIVQGDKGTP